MHTHPHTRTETYTHREIKIKIVIISRNPAARALPSSLDLHHGLSPAVLVRAPSETAVYTQQRRGARLDQ